MAHPNAGDTPIRGARAEQVEAVAAGEPLWPLRCDGEAFFQGEWLKAVRIDEFSGNIRFAVDVA